MSNNNLPRQTVDIDGVTLAFTITSSDTCKPVLLCLHAIGHDASDFQQIGERYQDRFRVVALDWPNHGQSSADQNGRHLRSRYSLLLAGFLKTLAFEQPIIIGNSIGADAAIHFAGQYPGQIKGLVLANPGGLADLNLSAKIAIKTLAFIFKQGARGAAWYPRFFTWYYHQVLKQDKAAKLRTRIIKNAAAIAPILADAWLGFALPTEDSKPHYLKINCPILFTWAKKDQIILLDRSQKTINQNLNHRLTLHDAGHCAFLESPDSFYQSFDRYLNQHNLLSAISKHIN